MDEKLIGRRRFLSSVKACAGLPLLSGVLYLPEFRLAAQPNSESKATSAKTICVTDFGAVGDGVKSDARAFQDAALRAHAMGGARVVIPTPKVAWLLDFPVYLLDNTEFAGTGKACRIVYKNPTFRKGRGGFVIGSSREANREMALAAYRLDNYLGATTHNPRYRNPDRKSYLRDKPSMAESKNSVIHDVYLVAEFDDSRESGGYAVNMVNALNCHAFNIWGDGWCQLIGMGSDTPPETPSNHLCSAYGLHVIAPDPVETYYSIGFIANSTDCVIRDAEQYTPIPVDTPNGSGVATNYVEGCRVGNVRIRSLGRSATSEGILLNNSKGCIVNNVLVGNAKKVISTFFTDASFNDPAAPNVIGPDIFGVDCDCVINLQAAYARVLGFKGVNSRYDVAFGNINAVYNSIDGDVHSILPGGGKSREWYIKMNKIARWHG